MNKLLKRTKAHKSLNHDEGVNAQEDPKQINTEDASNDQSAASNEKEKQYNQIATQTTPDRMPTVIAELTKKINGMEEAINHPKNGLAPLLAKNIAKVQDLHSDIHGAVDGILVRMEAISKTAAQNASNILLIQNTQTRMSALLDENKRIIQELRLMQGLVQKVSKQTTQTIKFKI